MPRAFSAGFREVDGRVWDARSSSSLEGEEAEEWVAKSRKASRMECSVEAEMLFSRATGEGVSAGGGLLVDGGLRAEARGYIGVLDSSS